MIEDKIKQEYEWQHSEIGQQLREIYQKLNEAGIQTRKVFWSREEKRRWYESQTVEKEL